MGRILPDISVFGSGSAVVVRERGVRGVLGVLPGCGGANNAAGGVEPRRTPTKPPRGCTIPQHTPRPRCCIPAKQALCTAKPPETPPSTCRCRSPLRPPRTPPSCPPARPLTPPRCHTNLPRNRRTQFCCPTPRPHSHRSQLTVQLPLPFTLPFGCGHIHKKAPFPV